MLRLLSLAAPAALLLPVLPAQIQLSVQSAAESGIAFEFPGGARTAQTFAANTQFTSGQTLNLVDGSPLPILQGSATMSHQVSPPWTGTLPWPIAIATNRVTIGNSARVTPNSQPLSLHTTASSGGAPGMQRYDVTMTAPGNTQALVTMRVAGEMFDNATMTVRVSGAGVNESWSLGASGIVNDPRQATVALMGTATLQVEITATVTPGPGTSFWDGYAVSLYIDAYDIGRSAFNLYGTGCGGTISGSGVPQVGQDFTVNLDNAPPDAMAILVLGDSRTSYGFLPLPLPLDYLGATGCFLNAAPVAQAMRTTDAAGHADVTLFLTRFTQDPTFYLQWVVFDTSLPGGLSTTRGAELLW